MRTSLASLLVFACGLTAHAADVSLTAGDATLSIAGIPARIKILNKGTVVVGAHAGGSLLLGDADHPEAASVTSQSYDQQGHLVLALKTQGGRSARAVVTLTPHQADFVITPPEPQSVQMRFAPASPAFGLADHAVTHRKSFDTELTGYSNDRFLSGQGLTRLVSNFVLYPKQKWAFLVWDPGVKLVRSTAEESLQGSRVAEGPTRFTVFFGTMAEIYRGFLDSRNEYGYTVMQPKYDFFGVGWEAFGALAWDTNHKTVKENVDQYLASGYPLKWMVVGSGFWPRDDKRFHETTSFGLYDKNLYPDPAGFISYFHSKGLKFFQGFRTTFITDGPFSEEGVRNGYFVMDQGKPQVFTFGWPKSPTYLLDWTKPGAISWYTDLVHRWTAFGVDGFKEDVFGFGKYPLRDDKLDPVNAPLMREGLYIMGRNAYLASYADLHRINDFNFNQNQDRGPVNALACAYAGFPLVYPDIVGGTFGEGHFDLKVTPRMKTYMMRNAQWAAVHPSMSMGQAPWTFNDKKVEEVMLRAAKLHDRLQPYFFSQAVRWSRDGYPWSMTPLPVAFPDDANVYDRDNDRIRGYEWMIGDALLAAPLYGNDYETVNARDLYLPAGTWIDYDTGEKYEGGKLLRGFALPVEKTPLFVGGSGIVIEKSESKTGEALVARIYPVAREASLTFYHPDGQHTSTIHVQMADAKKPGVKDSRGKTVAAVMRRHAWEFAIEPGVNYELR